MGDRLNIAHPKSNMATSSALRPSGAIPLSDLGVLDGISYIPILIETGSKISSTKNQAVRNQYRTTPGMTIPKYRKGVDLGTISKDTSVVQITDPRHVRIHPDSSLSQHSLRGLKETR